MAKKLVYNYTFTPGASNVGTIKIEGNYPTKTWQLITDAGTSGVYKHTFVRDELFSSTGAIEIITGGTGDLKVATVGTSLDEDTGIMTVTTSTAHGLSSGHTIKFREESITFTCAKDNYNSEKSYPRTTDPVYDTAITITVVDSDTFTVDVGRPVGGAISSNNEIIYNFSDTDKSGSAYYDSGLDETTLTLHHDTSHLDHRDDLQIFLDIQEDKIDFSETFVDPVSKLRVSNPQNLIDTDFEYGLQPTKWETVELVNNIPSFYSNSSDYSIKGLVAVSSVQGSQNITVQTTTQHGLSVGSPIDVQGLSSRTAEGKFLITAVQDTTTFVYKAKKAQESTGTLNGSYTVIIPGQFYQGSDVKHDDVTGVETDGGDPSSLTITTEHDHGFSAGSSIYLTNTVGRKQYTLNNTSTATAPDGRPYVDPTENLTTTFSIDPTQTETKKWTSTYSHKFGSSSVNTGSNTIAWTGNQLRQGDALLYIPPSGDSQIGGLERFQIYYVKVANTDSISLCETTNGNFTGNAEINLSSQGTSNFGRHQLMLCYELGYCQKLYRWRFTYTRYRQNSQGSGWDLQNYAIGNNSYNGLGQERPGRVMWVEKGTTVETLTGKFDLRSPCYRTSDNSNFDFGKSGTEPDGYDFVEDAQRFFNNSSYWSIFGNGSNSYVYTSYGQIYGYSNGQENLGGGSYTYYYLNSSSQRGKVFAFFMKPDSESDSLYKQNHGLVNNSLITLTKTSGDDIKYRTDTGTTYNQTPTWSTVGTGTTHIINVKGTDRFSLQGISRIDKVAGQYTVTGQAANPTANSFYLPSTDLVNNQKVAFSVGAGGVVPTSVFGALTPGLDTIDDVYSTVGTVLDGVKSDMGSDAGKLLWNRSNSVSGHWYPFSGQSTFDGGYQPLYMYRQTTVLRAFDTGTSSTYYYSSNLSSGWNTPYTTGKGFDIFRNNSTLADKGFYLATTPVEYNETCPWWLEIMQVPDISNMSVPAGGGVMDKCTYYYSSYWGYNSNYNSGGTPEEKRVNWNSWDTSLGDGWEYHHTANYHPPGNSGGVHGYINLTVQLTNTNWAGYKTRVNTSSQNIQYYGTSTRAFFPYTNSYNARQGQTYKIQTLIPIKAGSTDSHYGNSGSVKTFDQIALAIATAVKNQLTFSALTIGDVKLNQLNANRFALKNVTTNTTYNLTNSGTSPFIFSTEELTGGADGYYTIDVSNDKTTTSFTNARIPKRDLNFTHTGVTEIDNLVYININNNKLKTGQKVVYDEIAGSITGLTSATTYYAIATGPDHFQLADSGPAAITGQAVGITTWSSSGGNYKLTVPSISGVSEGIGTIGINSTSKTITGYESLFQRYYKSGDRLTIKDDAVNPPLYRDLIVESVIDDTELTVESPPDIGITSSKYYVNTKVFTRPDGAFLHRPFDGGVEINAGTSPNSSIVRQTRKYFRYQSGKGIQCSLAINFNPSRLAKSIVSSASTSIPVENYSVNVNNSGSGSYNLSGTDRNARLFGQNESVTIMKGDTIDFVVNASGHPFWVKTNQSTGTSNAVTTGITNNGTQTGTIAWDTTSVTAGTYYYNCENHASMSGSITVESAGITTTLAKVSTEYPHGLTRNNTVTVRGSTDNIYNGTFDIKASTDFDFTYYLPQVPSQSVPDGIIEYNIDSWTNSNIRCGLYDYQNGMFFEFDGTELWAVRRSSVQQLPGKGSVQKGDNVVTGTDTNFSGQLIAGDYVVIRGGSYRVTAIDSKTQMSIQPSYQGQTTTDAILTKTIDVRVRQSDWNIDKADGNGPSGFKLDITKIQMAYLDYSWYGAGKIRFGFKDTYGHVKYMHEFRHNNRLEEAYMRTGNIAGRYEIKNDGIPSYVPSLFHWGTSIIMDGKFDDDKAYLFTAASNTLQFTNGDSNSATTAATSTLERRWAGWPNYDWYVKIPFNTNDASKFSSGTALYTADGELDGELVDFTEYGQNRFNVYVYVATRNYYDGQPAVYPDISNNTTVNIGFPATGGEAVDLTKSIPLISIRLAPSVDNNLTGPLGAREIINRMQLQLKSLGITLTHDCSIDIILNGNTSNKQFSNVNSPSLSELIQHVAGDKITGGTKIFSLRASGGAENAAGRRLSATSDFDLSQITDLGNSILGGDGTYPNGPDLLTIALRPIDTAEINADTPLGVSSRVTWTESQA